MLTIQKRITRNRFILLMLLIVTLISGLLSRSQLIDLPEFIVMYAGDFLWTLLVYYLFAFTFNKQAIIKILFYALTFSYLIEISQFYQADWINEIRRTRMGALVLGHTFIWSDIVCYTAGAVTGTLSELILHKTKYYSSTRV